MSKLGRSLLITLTLGLVAQAWAQKLPWRAGEEEVLTASTRVLLVPPDVHVEKWTVSSGTETSATSDYVRRTICGEMDDLFEQRKLLVSDFPLCLGEGETTNERRDVLRTVQERFRELVNAWSKPGRRNGTDLLENFRLVEELEVTRKMETDVLVVVAADGSLASRGEKAMAAMGGGGAQGLMIHFGVIRARTGELLFFSEKYVGGDFLKHPEGLEKAIQKSVQAAFAAPAK